MSADFADHMLSIRFFRRDLHMLIMDKMTCISEYATYQIYTLFKPKHDDSLHSMYSRYIYINSHNLSEQ